MPAYAVEVDLNLSQTRLIELTDSDAAPGVKDTTLINQCEAEAERIVNAKISGSVTLPFVTIPSIITSITAWIWAYRIYRHREIMEIPKPIVDDYNLALSLLDGIAATGNVSIGLPASSNPGVPDVESSASRGWTPRDLVS